MKGAAYLGSNPSRRIHQMAKKQTILVIGAHSDDPAFGAGGTIAKYALEGCKVKSIIFSYGELSHPHLKPEIVAETRAKEAKISDKILGGKGIIFFDVKEGRFPQDIRTLKIEKEAGKPDWYQVPDDEFQKWMEALDPVNDKWLKRMNDKGLPGDKVLEEARRLAKK